MAVDHPVRSGLCHGPDCQAKITGESQSEDFCSDWCQARWHSDGCVTPCQLPSGHAGYCAWVDEPVEALRLDLSLGARHHLSGGVYEVTATDGRNATLTPVEATDG